MSINQNGGLTEMSDGATIVAFIIGIILFILFILFLIALIIYNNNDKSWQDIKIWYIFYMLFIIVISIIAGTIILMYFFNEYFSCRNNLNSSISGCFFTSLGSVFTLIARITNPSRHRY